MQTEKILELIVECGRTEKFSELEKLFPNWQPYQRFLEMLQDNINSANGTRNLHQFEIYSLLGDKYDFENLSYLIKGLTIAENNAKMGSVSPVITLYKKLVEKAGLLYFLSGDKMGILLLTKHLADKPHREIEDITHWILRNSNNIYLPFGISTLNSKTLPEIKNEVEGWKQRQQEFVIREEIEKAQKEERDAKRKVEIENHEKEHYVKTEEQRKYREHLKTLPLSQLLQTIIADNQRPIYFYTDELYQFENESFTSVDKDILKQLLQKFKQSETGQFKRLKSRLTAILD